MGKGVMMEGVGIATGKGQYTILIKIVNNGYILKLSGQGKENDRTYAFESIGSLTTWLENYLARMPDGGKLK